MTDEEQQVLSQQIAEVLDAAGIDRTLLWTSRWAQCSDGHFVETYQPNCTYRRPVDEESQVCGKPLSRKPRNMLDATTLLGAVEAWCDQDPENRCWSAERLLLAVPSKSYYGSLAIHREDEPMVEFAARAGAWTDALAQALLAAQAKGAAI